MNDVLKKLGLSDHRAKFVEEKVSTDTVYYLSIEDFLKLGLADRNAIMALRTECSTFGLCTPQRAVGNNKFVIPKIENLIDDGFSVKEMSNTLCVSEGTNLRRMVEYGLKIRDFSNISDDQLDSHVLALTNDYPFCDETILREVLKGRGIIIQRYRFRDSMHRVSEAGIQSRRKGRLKRRVYNVKGANHLWHIDTNHKLVKWYLIIFGAIDSDSRLPISMECIINNKAPTVLACFLKGVHTYGLPSRVRSDKGRDNVLVAEYMKKKRGPERSSMIIGPSTHNQRIERLWRDVFDGVIGFYYELFSFIEENIILDPLNEIDIAALHFNFIPLINEKLDASWHASCPNN